MQKPMSKRKIGALVTACSLLVGTSQAVLAQSIDEKFPAIKLPATAPQSEAAQHFVRLNLVSVSAWTYKQKEAGASPSHAEVAAYANMLNETLALKIAAFEAAGYTTSGPVTVSDVGFSVLAHKADMANMTSLSGVKEIIPQQIFSQQRDYSTPWVGAPAAHVSGFSGEGKTIAVIDTGIDYTHADFGGSGVSSDYDNNDPSLVEEGTFPTSRVIGGYDFAGLEYDAGIPSLSIAQPDADPLDDGTHGSHVSGIAAGGGIDGILGSGIAPEANLFALKVFGANGSTNLTNLAIEMAVDPNGDGDPSDAVDVINMSLGSPFGNPNDTSSVASQNANDAGVVVVASAGNSGNAIPFVSGSPGSADGVITVASTISGGVPSFFVPFELADGTSLEYFAAYSGISPALTSNITGDVAQAAPFDACTPLTSDLSGKVALITRGTCAFTDKLNNAEEAGAIAAIVVNSVPGAPIVMGGDPVSLPGAMISLEDGTELLGELASDAVNSELAAANTKSFTDDDNTMSAFSSRGPGPTGLFKPDISAPGSNITSALAGSGDATLTISGTSMASPQVAGMAAILRQKFPDLEPKAIKAIIQNTSTPASDPDSPTGTPALSLQGTGIINIEKAIQATSYAAPGGIGFGRIKPEYNESVTRNLTITNFSDTDKRYYVSYEPNNELAEGAATLSTVSEVYLQAGQSQDVEVTLDLAANAMVSGQGYTEYDGWILVTSGDEVMRVGYQALIDPASKLSVNSQSTGDNESTVSLVNTAFGEARVSGFTLAAQGTSDVDDAISAFGFREEGGTLLFGLNAANNWTNFSRKLVTMNIDIDEDGEIDYQLLAGDLFFFDSTLNDPSGDIVSALFSVNDNNPVLINNLQYFADAEFNTSVLQFRVDAYGADGFLRDGDTTFSYNVTLSDQYAAREEGTLRGNIDIATNVTFGVADLTVPAQATVPVSVIGTSTTLWLSPTESDSASAAIVE